MFKTSSLYLAVRSIDIVAMLSHVIPIDFGSTIQIIDGVPTPLPNENVVDCALARIVADDNGSNREIHWIGYPRALNLASAMLRPLIIMISKMGIEVHKMGRTTEYTVDRSIESSDTLQ